MYFTILGLLCAAAAAVLSITKSGSSANHILFASLVAVLLLIFLVAFLSLVSYCQQNKFGQKNRWVLWGHYFFHSCLMALCVVIAVGIHYANSDLAA
jgi:hypothetical protein